MTVIQVLLTCKITYPCTDDVEHANSTASYQSIQSLLLPIMYGSTLSSLKMLTVLGSVGLMTREYYHALVVSSLNRK